jgi:hypothetical protein
MDWDTLTWHSEWWNQYAFENLINARVPTARCKFVVAPDVIMNADATLTDFWHWRDYIQVLGYPVAYAAQDGATVENTPFGAFDALFIGGSNAFKFGPDCRAIVERAKWFGCWVHWGRASTPGFIHYAKALGCDSIDSSAFARFTEDRLPRALPLLTHTQHSLF